MTLRVAGVSRSSGLGFDGFVTLVEGRTTVLRRVSIKVAARGLQTRASAALPAAAAALEGRVSVDA